LRSFPRPRFRSAAAGLVFLAAIGCRPADLPPPTSPEYGETMAAFYRGVAAAQVGESQVALAAFRRVTELAPKEPAGWANLGVVALQRAELDTAFFRVDQALALAPGQSNLELLAGFVEQERGRQVEAQAHFREAARLDPRSARARYHLAESIERSGGPTSVAEARDLIEEILRFEPGNLAGLVTRARLDAKLGDAAGMLRAIDQLRERLARLPVAPPTALGATVARVRAGDFAGAGPEWAIVQSELQSLPDYLADQETLVVAPSWSGLLITRPIRLPSPSAEFAPADSGLAFELDSLAVGDSSLTWLGSAWLNETSPRALIATGPTTLWISTEPDRATAHPLPVSGREPGRGMAQVVPLDYDYDFLPDLLVAGPGGLRLFRQRDSGVVDAPAAAIPAAVMNHAYAGAWAVDLDLEGDLDLVLARVDGPPVVLRNRGDGTFEPAPTVAGITGLRQLAWGDFDADGDPDLALLDRGGRLHLLSNGRAQQPQFEPRPLPDSLGEILAVAAGDLDHDATVDLIVLAADGGVRRLTLDGERWTVELLARWPDLGSGTARLFVADLDNNGALDVLTAGGSATRIWLQGPTPIERAAPAGVAITDVADLTGDGRLDLIGLSGAGMPRLLINGGTRRYYSTAIHPRAAEATGDRRINPFGIGGEVEVRAGLLYQKQLITGPVVHFGLGEQPRVDVARIIWPNGTAQAEFNLTATNETVLARQRLKGSCPWVFTNDGREIRFVTDFLWRTALGLRINAQGSAGVIHSEDWVRIPGDQLRAIDGEYDVRITGELWESHFFDHVALMVVDHPAETEVFVDERFALPPPKLELHQTGPLRLVETARDQAGRDVRALIAARDGRYLDTFERGPYQGIARDHFVEITLGSVAADVQGQALWLVANGWIYPTDASINVASSQGSHPPPTGLRLEVADGHGGWTTVDANLGFPAGKTKTILIDLRRAFGAGGPRPVRLHTTMEIYWDQIGWAAGRADASVTTQRLLPTTATLRYRGFSEVTELSRTAPELPDYNRLGTTAPVWRDLVGRHTRLGDVQPLLEAVDDRYLIMNAGDEVQLRFSAPPPPRAGWTRDFVLIGDGWVKDGDFNTGFSTTVEPLPYHGLQDYSRPPGRLEDDPGYRRSPRDWSTYHTRYVSPRAWHRALVPASAHAASDPTDYR
jgi:tetratricopeptide (TPR) repeat protein